jgi:hypothetical protein
MRELFLAAESLEKEGEFVQHLLLNSLPWTA